MARCSCTCSAANVTIAAADLAAAVQAERNYVFVHLGLGLFYALVTLAAALLGVLGRDRGQFVFAALFAWLAIGEWRTSAHRCLRAWPAACGRPPVWVCVWNALMLLAAAQLLQLRERAPRWNRWMIGTGVLFLLFVPLLQVDASGPSAGRLSPPRVLFWVVGLAASWHVWRLGHRVGAVGVVLFALDAVVCGPYLLAQLVNHFVPIDIRPFEASDWATS